MVGPQPGRREAASALFKPSTATPKHHPAILAA